MNKYIQLVVSLVTIVLLTIFIPNAYAFNFEVDKIRMTLALDNPVDAIRIKNSSNTSPVSLQTQAFSWKQENGKDIYTPTNDLIIAPTVITIPPARSQIMRVGWRVPAPVTTEIAYRIYVQELSSLKALDTRIGVQLKLSLGIPVFIKPQTPTYAYEWSVKRGGKGLLVTFRNSGNMHIQINRIDILSQNNNIGSYTEPFYVLPQQSMQVDVPVKSTAGGSFRIMAATDYQPLVSDVSI